VQLGKVFSMLHSRFKMFKNMFNMGSLAVVPFEQFGQLEKACEIAGKRSRQ
jgi:hypothetical protein